jgi:hypothetical protein
MSHFSFSRSLYDECSLAKKDSESKGPFQWVTDKYVKESDESCFQASAPFKHNPINGVPESHLDIESDLRGQTRPLSRCPAAKYDPTQKQAVIAKLKECVSDKLVPEYTRINKPCNIFSGMSVNRFHPLCDDLQANVNIPSNSIFGKNTRLQVKDTYVRKVESKPFTIDDKNECDAQGTKCAFVKPF